MQAARLSATVAPPYCADLAAWWVGHVRSMSKHHMGWRPPAWAPAAGFVTVARVTLKVTQQGGQVALAIFVILVSAGDGIFMQGNLELCCKLAQCVCCRILTG